MKISAPTKIVIGLNVLGVVLLGTWFWAAISGHVLVPMCEGTSPMTVLEACMWLLNAPSSWLAHASASLLPEALQMQGTLVYVFWVVLVTPQWLAYVALWHVLVKHLEKSKAHAS